MRTVKLSELYFDKEEAEKRLATGEYMLLSINDEGKYLIVYVPYIPLMIT